MRRGDPQTSNMSILIFFFFNELRTILSSVQELTMAVNSFKNKTEWKDGHTHFPLGYLFRTTEKM